MRRFYDFNSVEPAEPKSFDFSDDSTCRARNSVLLRITRAETWEAIVDEMTCLCDEAAARQAERRGDALFNPPIARRYVEDRVVLDDPLKGYQIRDLNGYLQGFIMYTKFTMWLPKDHLRWQDPAQKNPTVKVMKQEDGEKYIGRTFKKIFDGVHYRGKVQSYSIGDSYAGGQIGLWHVIYDDGDEEDLEHHELKALKVISSESDLSCAHTDDNANGTTMSNSSTPASASSLTSQSEPVAALASDLQEHSHSCTGDALDTGVVWPRVAEITLLGALRCGGWLLELVLRELSSSGQYDFVVLSATKGAVAFYERHGFRHVGCAARHYTKPKPKPKPPAQHEHEPEHGHCEGDLEEDQEDDQLAPVAGEYEGWSGYRHFSYYAQDVPESYMMARRLRESDGREGDRAADMAAARGAAATAAWPAISIPSDATLARSLRSLLQGQDQGQGRDRSTDRRASRGTASRNAGRNAWVRHYLRELTPLQQHAEKGAEMVMAMDDGGCADFASASASASASVSACATESEGRGVSSNTSSKARTSKVGSTTKRKRDSNSSDSSSARKKPKPSQEPEQREKSQKSQKMEGGRDRGGMRRRRPRGMAPQQQRPAAGRMRQRSILSFGFGFVRRDQPPAPKPPKPTGEKPKPTPTVSPAATVRPSIVEAKAKASTSTGADLTNAVRVPSSFSTSVSAGSTNTPRRPCMGLKVASFFKKRAKTIDLTT